MTVLVKIAIRQKLVQSKLLVLGLDALQERENPLACQQLHMAVVMCASLSLLQTKVVH